MPTISRTVPTGPQWAYEIKHDATMGHDTGRSEGFCHPGPAHTPDGLSRGAWPAYEALNRSSARLASRSYSSAICFNKLRESGLYVSSAAKLRSSSGGAYLGVAEVEDEDEAVENGKHLFK